MSSVFQLLCPLYVWPLHPKPLWPQEYGKLLHVRFAASLKREFLHIHVCISLDIRVDASWMDGLIPILHPGRADFPKITFLFIQLATLHN